MKTRLIVVLLMLCGSLIACKDYLDVKPSNTLATIETVKDMQALLDFFNKVNSDAPGTANGCSDDYYVTNDVFNARSEYDRNLYLWKAENIFEPYSNAWSSAYELVHLANEVLAAVSKKEAGLPDKKAVAYIKAQALFHRARAFLGIVSIWAPAYDQNTAANTLGIPLRLDADFNKVSTRANLSDSYQQIISDLKVALPHLLTKDVSSVRASKVATYGYLSRTYLQMADYPNAALYADSALQISNTLLNFNTLSAAASFPIARQNVEVLFDSRAVAPGTASQSRALINPELYSLYQSNDLRKVIFYKASAGSFVFKGYYAGAPSVFNGVGTDELLLNRAEAYTQLGKLDEAMADLNYLLVNRYKTGTFVPYQNLSQSALLTLVKLERRKELAFRTLRWNDIKRWNLAGDGIELSRVVNGETSVLPPNSLRYALAIPEDIVRLTGMPQNPR